MNKWIKFIDSCVGNVARKIQDEFDESKHPRDKGGKFTSKGGEGRGGGKEEKLVRTHKAGNITPERADALNEAAVALEEQGVPKQKILKMSNEGDLEGMQKLLESKRSSESGDDSDNNSENEVSIDSLTGNETYGPAVVNALRYEYDGDPKKVGAVVNHLNNITSEPDMWGEYTVNEIIDDIEGRFGELSDVTKRHIDTYLRKTNPAEWASEAEYWKKKFKNNPGPHPQSFYE